MGEEGGLFRFADGVDKMLMFLGILGCIGEGLASPLTMYVTSGAIDAFGTSNQSIAKEVVDEIPNTVAQVCALVFGLVVAFLLSWRMALASLPFAVGFIVPGMTFGRLMMKTGVKSKDAYGIAGTIAEQAISNVRTVYSYVGEEKTVGKYGNALQETTKLGIKQGLTKGLMIGSMGMLFATWAFQAWVGGLLVTERGESGGRVFVAGASIISGGMACMTALPNVPFITDASAAAIRIFEMIDRDPEIDSTRDEGTILTNVRGQIEFRQVYFSYPSRKDELVLQGLSLKIKPGHKIGLVGGSGSGKSTIVSLLERFYDPIKGDILLDGHRIKRLHLKWYRSQFGLVSQEPVLFATSIKENILFGREDKASLEEVISAAKQANAHNFVVEFPQGYDTQVGQKQRIAIARALLRDPKILLLDEATSALDSHAESLVQEAIDQAAEGRTTVLIAHRLSSIRSVDTIMVQEAIDQASQGRTVLIIAHRLSSIRDVDSIMVLESGRVVESGSHDELMQTRNGESGVYSKMVRLQKSSLNHEFSPDQESPKKLMYSHSLSSRGGSTILNSPAFHFSRALSTSLLSSIQNSPVTSFSVHYGDDEKTDSYTSPSPSIWRLIEMNSPERKRALLGSIGAVVVGAILAVNSYCMGALISVYFENTSKVKSETRLYSIVFITICVVVFFCNILQHYNFGIMGEWLTKRIREKVLEKILTFEIGWFE